MHIDPISEDFLVMNYEAEYWTGTDWFHHPELSLDMTLENAVMLATKTAGTTILVASMMIHVDQGIDAEEGTIWIDYPDCSSDRYRDVKATSAAISDWLEKCTAPPASLLEQNALSAGGR